MKCWTLWISIPSASALVIMGGKTIELWVGYEALPSTSLLISCGIWMVVSTLGSTAAMFANARQLIASQIIAATFSGCVNIAVTI